MLSGSDLVKIAAVICLTAICITALNKGIDSALVGMVAGAIGGIVGYSVKRASKNYKRERE